MGDMINTIDEYCEMLCKELRKIVDKNDLSPQDLEIAEIIAETCKDFEKYKMMVYAGENIDIYEDYYRDGNNYNGYSRRYPDYMYDSGNDASRQSSGENYNGYRNGSRNYGRNGNYNYNRGSYYGHSESEMNEHVIKELERTMDMMPEGQAKDQIRQRVQQLRSQHN